MYKSKQFEQAKIAIVTLHGYGTNGQLFVNPVMDHFGSKIPDSLFFFPDAPLQSEISGGLKWFNLSNNLTFKELRDGLSEAAPYVFEKITKEIVGKQGVPLENINIIGFSQGAMLAFEMMYYADFQHIISYSGLFAFDSSKELKYKNNKVLIVHGNADSSVPYSNLKLSSESLDRLGVPHKIFTCHGLDHTISEEGFNQGINFILND